MFFRVLFVPRYLSFVDEPEVEDDDWISLNGLCYMNLDGISVVQRAYTLTSSSMESG